MGPLAVVDPNTVTHLSCVPLAGPVARHPDTVLGAKRSLRESPPLRVRGPRRAPPAARLSTQVSCGIKPRVREGAQLRDGFKEVRVQHLGSIAPIEALDVRVLIRLARLDVMRRHGVLLAPIDEGLPLLTRSSLPRNCESGGGAYASAAVQASSVASG